MTFNLKTLFVATAAIGVALYLLVSAPTYVAVPLLVLLDVALAASVLVGLVYGAGTLRAFCMGAMVPAGATMIAYTWMLALWLTAGPWETQGIDQLIVYLDEFAFTLRIASAYTWAIYILVGLVTVAARGALRRSGDLSQTKPPHDPPRRDDA